MFAIFIGLGLTGCGKDTASNSPHILMITPDDGGTNIPLNTNIMVTFDQPMDVKTIEGTQNFTLQKKDETTVVSGKVSYNPTTYTAIIDPDQNLQPETIYVIILTRDIKSSEGDPIIYRYSWEFTTGANLPNDDIPPTFIGANDIAVTDIGSGSITLRWDSAVDNYTDSLDIAYLIYLSKDSYSQNYQSPGFRTAYGVTSYLVTSLDPETTYYFVVLALDGSGNVSTRIKEVSATTGSAADTTPPDVITHRPLEGTTNVALNTNIVVTFSEDMETASINSSTVQLSGTGGVQVPGSVSYNSSTLSVMFNPDSDLGIETTYLCTVTTGVKDKAGNPLKKDYSFSFITTP